MPPRSRSRDADTMDLLGWQPPAAPAAFAPEVVRAATLRATLAKGVGAALKDAEKGREAIAQEMADYLGETVPKGMLDRYAAESSEEHVISLVRFVALIHATRDYRLLQLLAEPFGLAVIDARYLPAIEQAVIDDKIAELTQRRTLANRKWRGA